MGIKQIDADVMNLIDELKENKQQAKAAVPTTMAELTDRLKRLGEEWREDHKELLKDGKEKVHPVNARTVADILQRECTFILVDEDNPELALLAVYDLDEGIYQKGERYINRLAMCVERTLVENACKNVRHFLTTECDLKERTINKNLVVVNNGVYNLKKHELECFNSKYVFLNKVATDYIEGTEEPTFENWTLSNWLEELSDGDVNKEKLFWQIFSATINANYISETAMFFVSTEGRTGKGTFQQLLINLVGKKNFTSLKLAQFEEKFEVSGVYGKALVIGDDNNPNDFNATSETFKSIVTGDPVLINPKHEKPFSTRLTPFIVQSMNGLPRFKDVTDGLLRRLRVVKFNHVYKGDAGNRRIKDEYIYDKKLLEFILYKAINLKISEMIDTQESKEALYELEVDNNPILDFYETVMPELTSSRLPLRFLFDYYKAWCNNENNPTKMKQRTFTKEFKQIAEANGWKYYRNERMPLEGFHKKDEKLLLDMLPFKSGYLKINERVKQPLIEKQQGNNEAT